MVPEAVPLATTVPFTLTDALLSAAVAVNFMPVASIRETPYWVVAAVNAGWSVPALRVRPLRSALEDFPGAGVLVFVTLITYTFSVLPFCAVTLTVIKVSPSGVLMASEAAPLSTAVPFTFMVALLFFATGVT
ncbi:hypothetical protein D3C75_950640 [compost metagenome]